MYGCCWPLRSSGQAQPWYTIYLSNVCGTASLFRSVLMYECMWHSISLSLSFDVRMCVAQHLSFVPVLMYECMWHSISLSFSFDVRMYVAQSVCGTAPPFSFFLSVSPLVTSRRSRACRRRRRGGPRARAPARATPCAPPRGETERRKDGKAERRKDGKTEGGRKGPRAHACSGRKEVPPPSVGKTPPSRTWHTAIIHLYSSTA